MNAGMKVGPVFTFIFLRLFYGFNSVKFVLQLNDHGELRGPKARPVESQLL